MKTKILLFVVLSCSHLLFAQKLSHPLHAGRVNPVKQLVTNDTLRILAILVQFQEDNDTRTSGNGKFDLSVPAAPIIDAPPHDSSYFADHFLFAKNYFAKASNGKQHINATVLGTVITLSKQMREYAPLNGNLPLAQMIEESWKKADSIYAGFAFHSYDLFVVFHAGVGKDIDLRSALGYDPTPLDLPSLYFNLDALKKIFGAAYNGVPVQNSTFRIQNSMVLPETEVRQIPSIGGDFTLKLGINGLLVASIASHLGLPDLFDSKTGKTAIGRFGLMDGQSIFSFLGICPPEPSAWEKSYLGWTQPIEVYGNKTLSAPAVSLYSTGTDTVYRIPISAKEYFLVENRQRDAKQNGQTLWMKWKGQLIQKTFYFDDNTFNNTSIDSIYGVVVDVDELDWSLPGLINANNDYRGGILVWHIDETIIEKNLATNTINADPNLRGVDLEEADGSQDLGETYDFISPGSGSEDGSPLDYWFSGNISPIFKNEFSETTYPNSLSNTFARSHITVKNFSVSQPRMTFEVNVGDANIALLKHVKRSRIALGNFDKMLINDVNNNGDPEFILFDGLSINILKENFSAYTINPFGYFSSSLFPPVVIDNFFGNSTKMMGIVSGSAFSLTFIDSTASGGGIVVMVDTTITTPIHSVNNKIYIGTASGRVEKFFAPARRTMYKPFNSAVKLIALLPTEHWVAANADSLKNSFGNSVWLGGKTASELVNARLESNENVSSVVRFNDNSISIYDAQTLQLKQNFVAGYSGNSTLAIADINRDGKLDILVGTGSSLSAFNRNGTIVENFPFKTLDGGNVVGCPVVIGLKNSNSIAIVFGSTSGQLYAINEKGKMLPGFPLQTGGIVSSSAISADYLVAASTDTSVYFWKITGLFDTAKVYWNGYLATKSNSNFVENTGTVTQKSTELLPKKFAYNWPNPVYSGKTIIRYFLGKSADVKIKILNMAGELVDELQGTNYAGLDNEVQWDVAKIQSGIYFAQITANGSGEEQSQIIKIAVVK